MVKAHGKQVLLKGPLQQQARQKEKSDALLKKSNEALLEFRMRHPTLIPALEHCVNLLNHDPSKLQDALENADVQSK